MIKFLIVLAALVRLMLPAAAAGAGKVDIVWATEDFPPFYISQGPQAGNGTADRLISLIVGQLPAYEHTRQLLPIVRIIEELKAGAHVVCITFLKDETIARFAQYSQPVFIVPPQELILRKETWEREFQGARSILFRDAIAKKRLLLGVSNGRNYGNVLNPLIEKYRQENAKLVYVRTGDHFVGLSRMLLLKHIDMAIAYSGEQKFVSLDGSNSGDGQLVSVPITENAEPLAVYAVLPRTEWGDRILGDFNSTVAKLQRDPSFRTAITKWFEPTPKFDAALNRLTRKD